MASIVLNLHARFFAHKLSYDQLRRKSAGNLNVPLSHNHLPLSLTRRTIDARILTNLLRSNNQKIQSLSVEHTRPPVRLRSSLEEN
jgi:hypothetical protein